MVNLFRGKPFGPDSVRRPVTEREADGGKPGILP